MASKGLLENLVETSMLEEQEITLCDITLNRTTEDENLSSHRNFELKPKSITDASDIFYELEGTCSMGHCLSRPCSGRPSEAASSIERSSEISHGRETEDEFKTPNDSTPSLLSALDRFVGKAFHNRLSSTPLDMNLQHKYLNKATRFSSTPMGCPPHFEFKTELPVSFDFSKSLGEDSKLSQISSLNANLVSEISPIVAADRELTIKPSVRSEHALGDELRSTRDFHLKVPNATPENTLPFVIPPTHTKKLHPAVPMRATQRLAFFNRLKAVKPESSQQPGRISSSMFKSKPRYEATASKPISSAHLEMPERKQTTRNPEEVSNRPRLVGLRRMQGATVQTIPVKSIGKSSGSVARNAKKDWCSMKSTSQPSDTAVVLKKTGFGSGMPSSQPSAVLLGATMSIPRGNKRGGAASMAPNKKAKAENFESAKGNKSPLRRHHPPSMKKNQLTSASGHTVACNTTERLGRVGYYSNLNQKNEKTKESAVDLKSGQNESRIPVIKPAAGTASCRGTNNTNRSAPGNSFQRNSTFIPSLGKKAVAGPWRN